MEPNLPDELIDKLSESAGTEDKEYLKYVGEVIDLQGLLEHPGWLALQAHFDRGAENFERSLTRRLMSGEKVSQSEIDFHRGAQAVAKEIFARPVSAVKELERTAARAYARQLQRETTAESTESLYTDDQGVDDSA